MDSGYRPFFIETVPHSGGGSRHKVRAVPLPGQGVDTRCFVECCSGMRTNHPVGTVFKITGKLTDREGGTPFLYTSYHWPYEVVDRETARRTIAGDERGLT